MKHNESIGCSVTECTFHCQDDDYCTLHQITVSHDTKSGVAEGPAQTECASFKNK